MKLPTAFSGVNLTIKLLLGGSALILAGLAFYFVFVRPASIKTEAIVATGAKVQAEAASGAAKDSLDIVVKTQDVIRNIDIRTERSSNDILSSHGAGDTLDPALVRSGRAALCLHDNRSSDPVCAALLHPDGAGERP